VTTNPLAKGLAASFVLAGLPSSRPFHRRDCVEREIERLIEPAAWRRCEIVNEAEQESLKSILEKWGAS
jgi:hypothetical protein